MTKNQTNWIFVSAGEVSGDIHSSRLISEIKNRTTGYSFKGIGGDNLKNEGMDIFYHIKDISFMGFSEVIRHIPFFKKVIGNIKKIIRENKPVAAILVDYPGLNLRLAKILKKNNIPVFYYISPQVWAWGKKRVKTIRKYVDLMAVFFDFEKKFYEKYGVDVEFIGHPMVEKVTPKFNKEDFFKTYSINKDYITIGILPGSRTQEVENLLPPLKDAFDILKGKMKRLQGLVSVSPAVNDDIYKHILRDKDGITLVKGLTSDIMIHSDFLFVASGTVTVESAVAGTPMIVVYKISPVTYFLSRFLVNVNNFAMVNIIAGEEIVPELLQKQVYGSNIAKVAEKILKNEAYYNKIKESLTKVKEKLGKPGASERGAKIFIEKILQK